MDEIINLEETEEKSTIVNFDDRTICDENGMDKRYHNNYQIDSKNANVNMIIGRRANGKSYGTLTIDGIKEFIDSGYTDQFAYVRRWDTEMAIIQKDIFNGMVQNGWLEWYSKGEWNDVQYYRGKWYLRRLNEEHEVEDKCLTPMAYAFCVNTAEKAKGPDYPNIKKIIFDEFIPMSGRYCPKELTLWQNLISTIDRGRNKCKIYMIANTISKDCLHFDYYDIDPDALDQGKIYIKPCGTKGKLAIEYCKDVGEANTFESVYFKEDDEVGSMILTGGWQTRKFPALPENLDVDEVKTFTVYFLYKGKLLQCDFLHLGEVNTLYFSMCKEKTIEPDDLVFTDDVYPDAIGMSNVIVTLHTGNKISDVILKYLASSRCYYETDDIGEKIMNFAEK